MPDFFSGFAMARPRVQCSMERKSSRSCKQHADNQRNVGTHVRCNAVQISVTPWTSIQLSGYKLPSFTLFQVGLHLKNAILNELY